MTRVTLLRLCDQRAEKRFEPGIVEHPRPEQIGDIDGLGGPCVELGGDFER